MYELDFPNPYDDEEYGLELAEFAPKRRRKRKKNPEPAIAIATPVLLLGLAYFGWVVFNQTKYKVWEWQPWRLAGHTPILQLRRTNPTEEAQRQQVRQQAAYDRSVEKMMAPSPSVVEMPYIKPKFQPEEQVGFIVP